MDWKKISNNEVLSGDGFYISYNPNTAIGHADVTKLMNFFGEDVRDGEETALYHKPSDTWKILEGDFRKEYEEAFIGGYKACKEVYERNKKDHRSNWSTD